LIEKKFGQEINQITSKFAKNFSQKLASSVSSTSIENAAQFLKAGASTTEGQKLVKQLAEKEFESWAME